MPEITICVGNYGYYDEGKLHDTWLDLPKKRSEINTFLRTHQLRDRFHEEIYISDYDGIPFGFSYGTIFSEYTSLDDLNLLAATMQLYPNETKIVEEALSTGCDAPDSVIRLINWILQADNVPYYAYDIPDHMSSASAEEKLGYTLAQDTS